MKRTPHTADVLESYRKYSNKIDLKIAERNAVKFYAWLENAFPCELPWRVYAVQIEDGFSIFKAWNYGSVQGREYMAIIPMYDRFNPDFNPETFYKKYASK